MRIRDLNWMQLEEYLEQDDRIVLPVGSTEQHAYLSLDTLLYQRSAEDENRVWKAAVEGIRERLERRGAAAESTH